MRLFIMSMLLMLLLVTPCSATFRNFYSGSVGEFTTTGCVVGDSLYLSPGESVTSCHQWGLYQMDFDYIFPGANYWSHYTQFGTGVATYTASKSMYIDNFSVASVPEPSALMCLGAGLLGCMFRRKVRIG